MESVLGDGERMVGEGADGDARNLSGSQPGRSLGSSNTPDSDAPIKVDAALLREVIKMQSFTRWTGLEVITAENGVVETRLKLRADDMTQHHGFLHGGLVAFLADNAAAYAAATIVGDVLTAQFSLNFLSPGLGDSFRTRAEVIKAGRRQVTVRSDVFAQSDAGEKLVATATVLILPAGASVTDRVAAS